MGVPYCANAKEQKWMTSTIPLVLFFKGYLNVFAFKEVCNNFSGFQFHWKKLTVDMQAGYARKTLTKGTKGTAGSIFADSGCKVMQQKNLHLFILCLVGKLVDIYP